MTRRKSRSEAAIEAQLAQLDPGSPRYHVLAAARDFKAAWVALGDLLTKVREDGSWRGWGYASFDAYCRRELRVRTDTVNKLTRSFAFLRDHAPGSLEHYGDAQEAPPLDVVDLLARAPERSKLSKAQLAEVQAEVFAPDSDLASRNQVVKRLRDFDPDAFKPAARPVPLGGEGELKKALLLAERLQSLLEVQEGISPQALAGVRRAAAELRELFDATEQQQKSA